MKISREESSILKAIAILSVIITHANGWANAFSNIPILCRGKFTSFFCQGGMSIFLILSGYGLYKSFLKKGFDGYWDKKIPKIFIPSSIVQIIWFIIYGFIKGNLLDELSEASPTLFAELICISSENEIDGTMWYISFLLFCYLGFYIVFGVIKKADLGVLVFSLYWIIVMPIAMALWTNSRAYISSFWIGILLALLETKGCTEFLKSRVKQVVLLVAFSLGSAVYYFAIFRKYSVLDNIGSNLLAFSIILIIWLVGSKRLGFLSIVGQHSLAIFLLEGKLIFGWVNYDNYSDWIRFVIFIILFAMTIIVAIGVDYIINSLTAKLLK